jgi:hypothetical protein
MSQLGQSARERASDLGSSARYQVERAKSSLDYMMREQPLALGAIGLAVGAFVAALAPRTRKEDELMGDTRDRLMDQAKQVGKEKLGEVERVATAAMSTASQEAQRQGLMKPPQQQSGEQTPSTGKSTSAQAQPGATPPVTPKPGEKAGAATMHSGAATSSGSGNAS